MEATVSAHIAAPKIDTVKLRNVVGVIRGSDPALKDMYLMVTAHYDHLGINPALDGDKIFNDFTVEVYPERHHFDPPHRVEPERMARSLLALWERAPS